ncbi:hypothetical protein ACI79D_16535 [Geodermatophilus sp. SYSU D00708]
MTDRVAAPALPVPDRPAPAAPRPTPWRRLVAAVTAAHRASVPF